MHTYGLLQGAYVPAASVRNWIFHVPGATYDEAAERQGAHALPAVVQAELLRQRLQRGRRERRGGRLRQGQGRLLPGRQLRGPGDPVGAQERRRVHQHAARPEREVRRRRRDQPALAHRGAAASTRTSGAAYINWLISGPGMAQLSYQQNQIPGHPGRAGAEGQRLPDADLQGVAAARQGQRPGRSSPTGRRTRCSSTSASSCRSSSTAAPEPR